MPKTPTDTVIASSLSPPQRLALAYAPRRARQSWLAFLALDARLARVVREAREPVIGQIRLAWWRERLAEPAEAWPKGEPLLAMLQEWDGAHAAFAPLVDAWELLLGEPPLSHETLAEAVAGRAAGPVAVAAKLGIDRHDDVSRQARAWAAADFARGVSDPGEAVVLGELARTAGAGAARLPPAMRPLLVLRGLSGPERTDFRRLLTAVRLGIFGR